jgi:hypothetical protein
LPFLSFVKEEEKGGVEDFCWKGGEIRGRSDKIFSVQVGTTVATRKKKDSRTPFPPPSLLPLSPPLLVPMKIASTFPKIRARSNKRK